MIDEIEKNITMSDNVLDLGNDEYVYFNDISDFLLGIKYGVINNLNREKKYNAKFRNIENKLANKKNYSRNIRLYEKYLNDLQKILFFDRKLSGRGLTISSLPILLSKIYTNNSSKELINDIKQLVKNLYDNKQITKQVYNILNKALMSATFIKNDS